VIVPAVCAGYFLLHRQTASFAVALFWTGESIADVAVYMADAQRRALPLLGGEGVVHDPRGCSAGPGRSRPAADLAATISPQ
jgi:hypothetical protein